MSDGPPPPAAAVVTRVLEVLPHASTSPALVETADGALRVMKFAGAGPGPFGLLTELLALGIARALGAPVPAAEPDLPARGLPLAGRHRRVRRHAPAQQRLEPRHRLARRRPPRHRRRPRAPPRGDALDAIARADALLAERRPHREEPQPPRRRPAGSGPSTTTPASTSPAPSPAAPPSPALPAGHLLAGREPARPAAAPRPRRPRRRRARGLDRRRRHRPRRPRGRALDAATPQPR